MKSTMRKAIAVSVFVFLLFASLVAQQAAAPAQGGQLGLTDAMVKTAAIEVPRLVELAKVILLEAP